MATNTKNLGLLKKDVATDGNETFNIKTMLNDNWDKIDTAFGKPVYGNEIHGLRINANKNIEYYNTETTEWVEVKSGVDGAPIKAHNYKIPATSEGQTEFQIPLATFDPEIDVMLVMQNRTVLENDEYSITKPNAYYHVKLVEPVQDYENMTLSLFIIKGNVMISETVDIPTASITQPGIVGLTNELGESETLAVTQKALNDVAASKADKTVVVDTVAQLNRLRKQNNDQNKEIAFLKLKQDAADRIEGGTTFADDIQGNSFGITFNEEASENAVVRNGGLTMNVEAMVENNVDDSVVVEGSYNTASNGGRKLVRLDNGTLVCSLKTSNQYFLFKSVDDGKSWSQLDYGGPFANNVQDVCIATDGVYIYFLVCVQNASVACYVYDENGRTDAKTVQTSQTTLEKCSLAINEEGTELHACWSSRNSTYPNSWNIQYCKGVIGEGGTVTWGSVEQITSMNVSTVTYTTPTIVTNSLGRPVILYSDSNGSSKGILARVYDGTTWKQISVFGISTYIQQYPSAIFVPKSVNGLENGRIWVAWHGYDATDTTRSNIRVSYSDDNGLTWSSAEKLTSGNTYYQEFPSITANKNNEVYILWGGTQSGTNFMIRQIKWSNGSWGEIENIKQVSGYQSRYPSTLYDVTYELQFTKPPMVYTLGNYSSVNFAGSWQVDGYTPTTAATAVYTLPSTDYVGLFVQKEGDVNITATVNDTPMDAVLEGNEYQFTKALDSETPVTLKLSLSRENTTNGDNDKVTRILGGIS